MSSGLPSFAVLALYLSLTPFVSADRYEECESYSDEEHCFFLSSSPLPLVSGIVSLVAVILVIICCCVCPCCCLYKMCRNPQPVIATTTHTTVITSAQQYPRQPTGAPTPPQSYHGAQYPPYQPIPVQPGYGTQPTPLGYGAQPTPPGYGAQPTPQGYPISPYRGPPLAAEPPPTYQEATGPGYPPNPMPYSQAAFTPDQPLYPLQPPAQPQQPGAPRTGFPAQPAYNPDYVAPPPKTG